MDVRLNPLLINLATIIRGNSWEAQHDWEQRSARCSRTRLMNSVAPSPEWFEGDLLAARDTTLTSNASNRVAKL